MYNATDARLSQVVDLRAHLLIRDKKLAYCWNHKVRGTVIWRALCLRAEVSQRRRARGGNGGGTLNVLIDLFALAMFHLIQLIAYIRYILQFKVKSSSSGHASLKCECVHFFIFQTTVNASIFNSFSARYHFFRLILKAWKKHQGWTILWFCPFKNKITGLCGNNLHKIRMSALKCRNWELWHTVKSLIFPLYTVQYVAVRSIRLFSCKDNKNYEHIKQRTIFVSFLYIRTQLVSLQSKRRDT